MAKYNWQTIQNGDPGEPVDPTGNVTGNEVSQVMNVQKGCVLRTRLSGVIKADVYIPEEYWDGKGFTMNDPDSGNSTTTRQQSVQIPFYTGQDNLNFTDYGHGNNIPTNPGIYCIADHTKPFKPLHLGWKSNLILAMSDPQVVTLLNQSDNYHIFLDIRDDDLARIVDVYHIKKQFK